MLRNPYICVVMRDEYTESIPKKYTENKYATQDYIWIPLL